jgi:hypothetical protein
MWLLMLHLCLSGFPILVRLKLGGGSRINQFNRRVRKVRIQFPFFASFVKSLCVLCGYWILSFYKNLI